MKKYILMLCAFLIAVSCFLGVSAEPTESPAAAQTEQSGNPNRKKTEEAEAKPTKAPEPSSKPATEADTEDASSESDETDEDEEEEDDLYLPNGLPNVYGHAAIVMNANTGTVIFEKNSHDKVYPASTTKIMTALLAIENLDMDKKVTASKAAVSIAPDSSKMDLVEGEILTVRELLLALMLHSANDAANALAEEVSGSIGSFVTLMNERAREIGMENTNFMNPHGYHDKDHYTTAYDMVLLGKEAMENEVFQEISLTQRMTIPPTNKTEKERKYWTRNYLISHNSNPDIRYVYGTGIKTGSTSDAGQCFVGSAKLGSMVLISAIFRSPQDNPNRVFIDTKSMFKYGFNNYRVRTVQKGEELASTCNVKFARGKSNLVLKTNEDIVALLPSADYFADNLRSEINIAENIVAPIKEGDVLGEIIFLYGEDEVARSPLYASRDVGKSLVKQFFSYIFNIWFILIFGVIVVVILLRRRKVRTREARLRELRTNRKGKR